MINYLVALSTADTNKWSILLDQRFHEPTPKKTGANDERTGPIRQRQKRLNDALTTEMAIRYREGATVYLLAIEFNIDRRTVSDRLKKVEVGMRLQSSPGELINEMTLLYKVGLSFATIGMRLNVSPQTIRHYVKESGVQIRNAHWRTEQEETSGLTEDLYLR